MSQLSGVWCCFALAVSFGIKPVAACDGEMTVWNTMLESRVILWSNQGITHHLAAKIAVTPEQRGAGFQHICTSSVRAWAMLFVFPSSQRHTFHMRNVREELDIVFIGEDGLVLELKKMPREDGSSNARRYSVAQPYRYAIEAAAGRLSALGLGEGSWWLVLDPAWI